MVPKVTLPLLRKKKERGEKIVVITCYDYPSALLLDQAGADILFVGDSLGDNVLGYDTTIPVTMDEIVHHTKAVRRSRCWRSVTSPRPARPRPLRRCAPAE